MAGQKQHVEIHRKLDLRRRLLTKARPGPVYVPFIGDADIARELYADRLIYGTDIDPDRVASARFNLDHAGATARVEVADADGPWPFADANPELPFAVADLDSYAYPYHAFRAWWADAPKADRVVVFGTDGQRLPIKRGTNSCTLPDGTKQQLFGDKAQKLAQAREIRNKYISKILRPWLEGVCKADGWRLAEFAHFLRSDMVYWGAVLDREGAAGPPGTPPPKRRGFAARSDDLLDLVTDGKTIDEAAAAVGFSPSTVYKYARGHPDFRARLDAVLDAIERGVDPKFDDQRRADYVEALRAMRPTTAARSVGIDPRTVSRHRAADPEFDQLCQEADTEKDDLVEDSLFQAAVSGNVVAAQVWLYNRRPDRWTDKRSRGQESGNAATPGPEGAADATIEAEDFLADLLTRNGPAAVDLVGQLEQMFTPPPEDAPAADTGS